MKEILPIVNREGVVISKLDREACHNGSMDLHPVVHLHIFDRNGKLILQKRSEDKLVQPGKWDTAVGGHISYGEDVLESLRREAEEEVNHINMHPRLLTKYIWESEIEREFVHVYYDLINDIRFLETSDEVSEVKEFSNQEIIEMYNKGYLTPNFWFEYENFIYDKNHQ